MTIEELQAQVGQLQQELAERSTELLHVTEEFNEHKSQAEKVISELYEEKHKLEDQVQSLHQELEEKDAYIAELKSQIEALSKDGCILPTAIGIIEGIIDLPVSEKLALAFIARTEKQGREAFVTMIYGKSGQVVDPNSQTKVA